MKLIEIRRVLRRGTDLNLLYSYISSTVLLAMSSLTTDIFLKQSSNTTSDSLRPSHLDPQRRISLTASHKEATDLLNNPCDTKDAINIKADNSNKKREIYKFKADWLVSSLAWRNNVSETFQIAISSYIEDYINWVQIVSLSRDHYYEEIESIASFQHPYPATKVLWVPKAPDSQTSQLPNLLATTADYLRIWRVSDKPIRKRDTGVNSSTDSESTSRDSFVKLECLLKSNQGLDQCAPLTSFDWNEVDPSIIVTASIDTTCALWDIETASMIVRSDDYTNSPVSCTLRSQILAHNHEVYDVSFSRSGSGRDMFVSAGGDGSVRLFDLRRLSSVKVLYETDKMASNALVRVSCNKQDSNLISVFAMNSENIMILDVRRPGIPVAVLSNHNANLNGMSWAPHSAHHICSASDDHQALIWELSKLPDPIDEPLLAYRADGKINVISWSASHPDWIAIGYQNYLELLRV